MRLFKEEKSEIVATLRPSQKLKRDLKSHDIELNVFDI